MIRRVYANQHGIITLDSDMFGNRKRLSTGKKSDKRLLKWYEKHFEQEYEHLYQEKNKCESSCVDVTFQNYGMNVIKITSANRNKFTQQRALTIFEKLCKTFGHMRLNEIKRTDIMEWQYNCKLAPKTVRNYREFLNLILQYAFDDDIIRRNPVKLVKAPPKIGVKELVVYYEDDIRKIINAAEGQLKNYIQLCFFTGLRGSEMIALRWKDDIDFEKGIIKVDSRIRAGDEDVTKSKKIRYIPMFPQAREALLRQRKMTGLSEFVFLNRFGQTYRNHREISDSFKILTKKIGVAIGTGHDMRRSFNTLLKQYGYPQDWILDIMGHMDDVVNRNHYTGKLRVDMSKLGAIAV
ncbi:MAG: tyrosine-type recombinase/integrase [Sulfuricurvum sp.]|nr:tyrosine-type recombinase/integrase [Sulfuricurvum sp.]